MEDEEGKIRRNLVIASSLVISFAWLRLSAINVVQKVTSLDSADVHGIPAWRFWIVVLVVLIYLFGRYYFSAEHADGREHFKIDLRVAKRGWTNSYLTDLISSGLHTDKKSEVFGKTLHALVRHKAKQLVGSDVPNEQLPQCTRFSIAKLNISDDELTGDVTLVLHFALDGEDMGHSDVLIGFSLSKWQQIRMRARCALSTTIWSKGSLDFLVPTLLGVIAMGISAWELVAIARSG